jgi:asparagine synthase (glutamine-hydrolysing)
MPLGQWLKGPLRGWAEDLLNPEKIMEDGILNSVPINRKWKEHVDGVTKWDAQLWSVLTFQAWIREFKAQH